MTNLTRFFGEYTLCDNPDKAELASRQTNGEPAPPPDVTLVKWLVLERLGLERLGLEQLVLEQLGPERS